MSNKADIMSLATDLKGLGCSAADIARYLHRSPERIRQVLRDCGMSKPTFRSLEDLPNDVRQRVLAFRNLTNGNET